MISSGNAKDAALLQASLGRAAAISSLTSDAVAGTLQHTPAPIAHLDVVHPFPLPVHPVIPYPGDPGAYSTAAALEDR